MTRMEGADCTFDEKTLLALKCHFVVTHSATNESELSCTLILYCMIYLKNCNEI